MVNADPFDPDWPEYTYNEERIVDMRLKLMDSSYLEDAVNSIASVVSAKLCRSWTDDGRTRG